MAEETVIEVQIGQASPQPPQFSLQFSIKFGGPSANQPNPAFQSLLEAPLSPFQPCLVLETSGEMQAQTLLQVITGITELPAETMQSGVIGTVLSFIRSQGAIRVQTKGKSVVISLEFEGIQKERYRGYLEALAAQTKPLRESETTVTLLVAMQEALDQLFQYENVVQAACGDLRLKLQTSLSPHLCQGLSQLALNMSAPDFLQRAFTYFSLFRNGHISLQFYSYEQVPAAAQALFPSISPLIALLEALKALIGEQDQRTILTIAELMTGSGHVGFSGKFFTVTAEITAIGLSRLILS